MSESNYRHFVDLNRDLLKCYSLVVPVQYKQMDPQTQRDFCYAERVRVEDQLIRGTVTPRDFFAAAHAYK